VGSVCSGRDLVRAFEVAGSRSAETRGEPVMSDSCDVETGNAKPSTRARLGLRYPWSGYSFTEDGSGCRRTDVGGV
jgi:hypothetical protein